MIALIALLLTTGPSKGTLSVRSMTGGAKVSLDGAAVGTVPLILRGVTAGKHHVRVQRLGYLAQDEDVNIVAGKTAELEADLLPSAGVVKVTSPTRGAQVFVDGKAAGGVPYEGEVGIGKRVIEIRKDGYAGYKQVLQVGAGNDYPVSATLKKGSGAPLQASTDIPLVAVAPRRSKARSTELALEAPPPSGPKTPLFVQPAPMQTETTVSSAGGPIYQKWWFWTVAGVVVAGAVVAGVVVGTQSGPSTCFANGSAACGFPAQHL